MSRDQVSRSLKINRLSDTAKAEAERLDLAGNQTALLTAAESEDPSAPVQALRDHADYTSPTGQKGVSKVYKRLCRDWDEASDEDRAKFRWFQQLLPIRGRGSPAPTQRTTEPSP